MGEKHGDFVWADARNLPSVSTDTLYHFLSRNELFQSAESRGKKHASSCRESYGDKAVGRVKVKRDGNICTVQAEVCPEHRVRKSGYTVKVLIEEDDISVIKSCECFGCVASAGGCKHSLAFITWLHRRTEEPAVTSTQCYWKKGRLSRVGSIIFKAKHYNKRKTNAFQQSIQLSEGECNEFFNDFLSQAIGKSSPFQLMNHYQQPSVCKRMSIHVLYHNFTDTRRTSFPEFLEYCKDQCSDFLIKEVQDATIFQSKSPDWYHVKYGRISGSTLHDLSRCKTPEGCLVEKILGAKFEPTAAMRRGLDIEADVLSCVEKHINTQISTCGFILSKEYPLLGSSPDGLSDEAVFEVKSPTSIKNKKYYVLDNGRVAEKVMCQLQLGMLLTNKKTGFLCIADPNFEINKAFEMYRVDFEYQYVMDKMLAAQNFYEKHVFPIIGGNK